MKEEDVRHEPVSSDDGEAIDVCPICFAIIEAQDDVAKTRDAKMAHFDCVFPRR